MEDIYSFYLENDEFERLLAGKKTIQIVLNDAKHKVYQQGNVINFIRKTGDEPLEENVVVKVQATIENILYFSSLNDLFDTLGKEKCGYRPSSTTEKASDKFLSQEKYEAIEKNGLAAIIFKLN